MKILIHGDKSPWHEHFESYVAGIEIGAQALRAHAVEAGLVADSSVTSLAGIGDWFVSELVSPRSPYADRSPASWDPAVPFAGDGSAVGQIAPFTRQRILLIDEVSSYLAEVLICAFPTAKWVTFVGRRRELRRGSTLLQLGDKKWPAQPLDIVYLQALHALDGTVAAAGWLEREARIELAGRYAAPS